MEAKFIRQVNTLTVWLTLATCAPISYFYSPIEAFGVVVGAGWGLTNLYFLSKFLIEWLLHKRQSAVRFYTYLFIKFPLIYFLGYLLLVVDIFPVLIFTLGFSLLFISIFMIGITNFFSDKSKTSIGSNL